MKRILWFVLASLATFGPASAAPSVAVIKFPALDMQKVAAEDLANASKERPQRFAVARDFEAVPGRQGEWADFADGTSEWRLKVVTPDAVHLNFGFTRFHLPPSASLRIVSDGGKAELGPFDASHNAPTGQLWTQVLPGSSAELVLRVATREKLLVDLALTRVGHGYTGFGFNAKHCKSGACNTDVACLGDSDPWNENRRAVAAITVGGTDTCSGSLVNNSANNRRLLFATATHCGITAANVASMLAYFNYESPTCRTPAASGQSPVVPKPNTTLAGLAFVAATNNPFAGSTPAGTRSDWTLLELATRPEQSSYNLFWAGWDRRPPPTTCTSPGTPSGTAGLCASIHHPGVEEKRITFVEVPMTLDNISGASGVHWQANWDPTPPILPNLPAPQPTSVPPAVTEPGSSGSALYNADRRLVGVLSGGPSACGATGASLRDQYGGLFHAWDGLGTPTTRMRDHLDPSNTGVDFIDGIGQCNPPAAPQGATATANGNNRIDITWTAVAGAERYRVFRGTGSCPGTGFAQITEVTGTSFNDTTVSGGSTYSYRIAAFDDGEACLSTQGTCTSATAAGVCSLAPGFSGLASAQSAGTQSCGINLAWSSASGNCGANSSLRYNVFKSTTAGFTPAPANRIVQCATAITLADSNVLSGTRYHYVVRAEDVGATGGGVCGGTEEPNLVQRSAIPGGPVSGLVTDDVETDNANLAVAGTGAGSNFAVVTTQANSPTRSWFVPNPNAVSDRTLTTVNGLPVTASGPAALSFFHRFDTEASTGTPTLGYDGGVLEYSLDGGATWTDILAAQGTVPANAGRITAAGYTRTISPTFGSPLAGRQAWSGVSGGGATPAWIQSTVSLADFVGRTLQLRFRFASDATIADVGWWIYDIQVPAASACTTGPSDLLFASGFEP
jgi:lysyl endopeptidase